jgi:hypothetical protein
VRLGGLWPRGAEVVRPCRSVSIRAERCRLFGPWHERVEVLIAGMLIFISEEKL